MIESLILIIAYTALGFLFYLFNEIEDECMKNTFKDKSSWWRTKDSWVNKWKTRSDGTLMPFVPKWYYFGTRPAFKEKFFLSSTVLVFLTDGEHFFQFLKFRMVGIALVGLSVLIYFDYPYAVALPIAFLLGTYYSRIVKETLLKQIN